MEGPTLQDLQLNNIRPLQVLGNGATGTVFLVHDLISDPCAISPFALKVVEKVSLNSNRRAKWEISVLDRLSYNRHAFLPFLIGSFETQEFLAWAIPFCPGRDLNVVRHCQPDNVFSVQVIRFYLAEIVCALEHLHNMSIVYRDLKPENVLIQESGHVTLTDFDLSRTLYHEKQDDMYTKGLKKRKSARVTPVSRTNERSNSFVGTEEYVSPEMVRGEGHEFAVDWWTLGILAYEMLYGTTPFRGKNRKDTYGKILMMQPKFNGKLTPLTDLISKLLQKDPTRRIGYQNGACEIKQHPFFIGLQWNMLTEMVRPPYIPSRDNVEITAKTSCGNITEYFKKLKEGSLRLDSPLCNVSLTEF